MSVGKGPDSSQLSAIMIVTITESRAKPASPGRNSHVHDPMTRMVLVKLNKMPCKLMPRQTKP